MSVYTPVVKAKSNDIAAIALLSDSAKRNIKPLVEAPVSINTGNIETNVSDAVTLLSGKLDSIPYFFDPLGIESHARQIAAFEVLAEADCNFTPTIGLGRGPLDIKSLRNLAKSYGKGMCIRLEFADLEDASEDTWDQLIRLSSDIRIDASDFEILIDYRQVDKHSLSALKNLTLDFLALQPKGFRVGDITLLGGSALSSVGGIDVDSMKPIRRRELFLWAELNYELGGSRALRFGDYGILNPEFVFAGANPNANAKIRYTQGSNILYFRGHGLYNPSRFDQYHELAQTVVESGYFLGRKFSVGDETIQCCADREIGPGNLATWVKVDTNHHIQLTSAQIARVINQFQDLSQESQVRELVESL